MRPAHLSLGLSDRDRVNHAFGGGLPRGSLVLFEGPDGAGKSVVTQRLVYGMAEEGTGVGVVSTELTAREFIDQMHSLSYDVVSHLLEDRLVFFHADVDTHDREGAATRERRELLSRLCSPSPLWRGDVVVVDAFDALLRNDPTFDAAVERGDEDHAMERVISFVRRVTATGTVVVLTVNPTSVTERAMRPLRAVADVYVELQTTTVGQEIRNQGLVRRFSGMKEPVDDTIGFSVQQGRGIVIESRTIA